MKEIVLSAVAIWDSLIKTTASYLCFLKLIIHKIIHVWSNPW